MNKAKRILIMLLAVLLLLGAMPVFAAGQGDGAALLKIQWDGTTYEIKMNSDYDTGKGVSWTCDNDGNFTISFTKSGTFKVVEGNVTAASATVIGGGGGGDSAYIAERTGGNLPYYQGQGYGGNGGGGGKHATGNVLAQFAVGTTTSVTVGKGGAGGDIYNAMVVDLYSANWSGLAQVKGSDGGRSSFGSITAAGGKGGGGGKGGTNSIVNGGDPNGAAGPSAGDGGGGAGVGRLEDPGNGVVCYICNGSGTSPYHGGAGNAGGGDGGSPANDHSGTDHDFNAGVQYGKNGTDGTGGGGGGGAFGTRQFRIDSQRWDDDDWSFNWSPGSGSANYGGWGGDGGNGGSGKVTVSGKVQIGVPFSIVKVSASTAITNGNGCYSLAGAVYGLYSDSGCKSLLEELTTDASGKAATKGLYAPGTYYIKEITASPGYMLDAKTHTIVIDGSGNVTEK